jgi:hypothetical protein
VSTSIPGEEGEHDRRERGDEVEPLLRLEVEDVPGGDPECQLDQRDGDPEFDRGHARDQHGGGKDGGELNRLHVGTSTSRLLDVR